MEVICLSRNIPEAAKGAVIALGNFDGVHPGHKAVIGKAREIAGSTGKKLAVLTFEPHPLSLFRKEVLPARLSTPRGKINLLAKEGVDICFLARFSRKFAGTEAEEFVSGWLCAKTGLSHAVTGHDFNFGKGRKGNSELMASLASRLGFGYTRVEAKRNDGVIYSSSKVRKLLKEGKPGEAALLLGRFPELEGVVERGDGRGREIGFPTANIRLKPLLLRPARGVYAIKARIGGREAEGVCNFGVRPSFGGEKEVLEAHLFDFSGDIYNERISVQLIGFIRPEMKFSGVAELRERIKRDSEAAREILHAA